MPSTGKREVSAAAFLPDQRGIRALREAAQQCRGCDLYLHATQTVFGEGPARARLMLVGEMPGDQEDLQGHPFVGPAGALLDRAFEEVGYSRGDVYVTNAVKHFRFEERGTRRLHAKPHLRQVKACRPWLEAERDAVEPHTIVCLGATAAQAILGNSFRITRQRGELLESPWAEWVLATWHPAAILRAPDHESRERMRRELFDDLRTAVESLSKEGASAGTVRSRAGREGRTE